MRLPRAAAVATLVAMTLLAVSCAIEAPELDSAGTDTAGPTEPTAIPQIEPTALPPPTPQPTVPPAATAEPEPEPTATTEAPLATTVPTPAPDRPPPLPTVTDEQEFQPTIVPAGLTSIPVHDTTFQLAEPRPILQLGGHTLIYLDDQAGSEVDIFTPVALDDGTMIDTYDGVVSFLLSSPLLMLEESEPVTIAGHSTRVFEGLGLERSRAFITDEGELKNPDVGWVPPDQIKLWVVDHPRGTVIVSAEALNESNQYSDALVLAADILSTINFG